MVPHPDLPPAPHGLSPRTAGIWAAITTDYELDAGQLALLEEALRSLVRADQARVIVETEGPVVWDRFKQPRPHPAVGIEKDARGLFARLFREIGLDSSALPDSRPPSIPQRYDD